MSLKDVLLTTCSHVDEPCGLFWPEGTEDRDSKMVMPGDNVELRCELLHPLAVDKGQRFTVREGGRTVGTAIITQIME